MDFKPRLLRPVPTQRGTYLRPGRQDHRALQEFLSGGTPSGLEGVVLDPSLELRQEDLRADVLERRLEAVVDPRAMELATDGGFARFGANLPWAGAEKDTPRALKGSNGKRLVDGLVRWLRDRQYTAVLAPAHFLADSARLSVVPESLRSTRYLEEVLRPATDRIIRAAKVEPVLEGTRKRIEAWRFTLGAMLEDAPSRTFSAAPIGQRIRTSWSA